MRHLKAGRRLGVDTAHRRAMMRGMVTSLLENQQITCTVARAKELRKPLDKMITLAKRGDLHSRRQVLQFVKTKKAMKNLYDDFVERYKDRDGGFSRIIKLHHRRKGDGAEMAIVQLIDSPKDVLSNLKNKKKAMTTQEEETSTLQSISAEVSKSDQVVKAAAPTVEGKTDEVNAEASQQEVASASVDETGDQPKVEVASTDSEAKEEKPAEKA